MTIQVTIIGTGQIGASFGLALAEKKDLLVRVGHDKDLKTARKAEKIGALDRVENNLPRAVRDAELILLCLPIDQIRPTLEIIGPIIKDGAVVMETGLAKEAASSWARDLLPAGRFYIGLTPVINPAYLLETETGIEAAHADLFKDGIIGITAPATTDSGAIKLAADLARLVGANPLFVDSMEIDGLMSSTHLMPQLFSAVLLNATINQPGWMEARKVAGRMYAKASEPVGLLNHPDELSEGLILNRDNIIRVLDNLIAALYDIRNDIEKNDQAALKESLADAHSSRRNWWVARQLSDWVNESVSKSDLPRDPGMLGRLIGLGGKPKKKT